MSNVVLTVTDPEEALAHCRRILEAIDPYDARRITVWLADEWAHFDIVSDMEGNTRKL